MPRRPLTPSDERDSIPEMSDQAQCSLYRLPLELRGEIYKQVLGYSNIHVTGSRQLHHLRCKCASCPGYAVKYDRSRTWKSRWECDGIKYAHDGDSLQTELLRTCRRIYSEAIDLLYSANTFSFIDGPSLPRFLAAVIPPRRPGIHTIHIDANFSWPNASLLYDTPSPGTDDRFRKEVWDTLAALPNLQYLEFRIHPFPARIKAKHIHDVIPETPLWSKRSLRRVRLYVEKHLIPRFWHSADRLRRGICMIGSGLQRIRHFRDGAFISMNRHDLIFEKVNV